MSTRQKGLFMQVKQPVNPVTAATTVTCTRCAWALPRVDHRGQDTSDRPVNADYVDTVMPEIGRHIDATGHPVRVHLTSFWGDRPDEKTSMILQAKGTR